MSADIIPFVPRVVSGHGPRDTACLVRFPARQVVDLTMDHADTAPCEYLPPCEPWRGENEPA